MEDDDEEYVSLLLHSEELSLDVRNVRRLRVQTSLYFFWVNVLLTFTFIPRATWVLLLVLALIFDV